MSAINVSLLNAASAKAQLVSLPRDMTFAELQTLAPKNVVFSVAGCTPASATTLGDLYDACADKDTLEVRFMQPMRMGAGFSCCTPCCSTGYDAQLEKEINKSVADLQNSIDAQGGTDALVRQQLTGR